MTSWDFVYEDGPLMKACVKAARRASAAWDIEYDDAFQEAVIWLAAHPNVQDRFDEVDGAYKNVAHLAQQIYANGLREACVRESYGGMTNLPHENDHVVPIAVGGRVAYEELADAQ